MWQTLVPHGRSRPTYNTLLRISRSKQERTQPRAKACELAYNRNGRSPQDKLRRSACPQSHRVHIHRKGVGGPPIFHGPIHATGKTRCAISGSRSGGAGRQRGLARLRNYCTIAATTAALPHWRSARNGVMGYRDVRYAGFDKTLINLKIPHGPLSATRLRTNSWLAGIRLSV